MWYYALTKTTWPVLVEGVFTDWSLCADAEERVEEYAVWGTHDSGS